jgi:hypothetical protein
VRVPLLGGYYVAPSLISSAQRVCNLYGEKAQEGAAAPFLDRLTPGLRPLATPPVAGASRGLFTAGSGDLYGVVGGAVYYIAPDWTYTALGTIRDGITQATASDNGLTMLLADGSDAGYQIDLTARAMTPITDPNFFGSVRLDGLDSYILGNIPGTRTFFSSDNNAVTFDPLFVANKSGASDTLVSVAVVNREIWLIGATSCEIWFNAGGADFPFQIMAGPFIQTGCAAPYSVCRQGAALFWLGQDKFGGRVVMRGEGYKAERISTHSIENAIAKYAVVSDAVAFCYQQEGHQFYVLTFPSADKTWCYDVATGLWHERVWTDSSGAEHRHRAGCGTYAYGVNVVADWETGALYALDANTLTDNGAPIVRRRGFPTMVQDGDRVLYSQFIADLAVGASIGTTEGDPGHQILSDGGGIFGLLSGPVIPDTSPQIYLRWSDDNGATWSNPVANTMGATGQYLTSVQWQRLGTGRNRIFELVWAEPVKTALQGAFVTSRKLGS